MVLDTVISAGHVITGSILSVTVTVAAHVELKPFEFVTVNVTVFAPISAQLKEEGLTENVSAAPFGSVEPLLTSFPDIEAFPAASNETVISWQFAVGENN